MEWKDVEPEQKDWQKQWNLTAYYGEHIVGSVVFNNDGDGEFYSVINGSAEFMAVSNLDEAKTEFYDRLDSYLSGEIDYYKELRIMLSAME